MKKSADAEAEAEAYVDKRVQVYRTRPKTVAVSIIKIGSSGWVKTGGHFACAGS